MQEPASTPSSDGEKSNLSTLVIALTTVSCVVAALVFFDFGMSTLVDEDDPPYIVFTDNDNHLEFHYFSDPKRRTLKSVPSIRQIPRQYHRRVIVTEPGENPLETETIYVANLFEQSPTGNIRAHKFRIEQIIFAMDMEAHAHREAIQQQRQMPSAMPPARPPGAGFPGQMDGFTPPNLKDGELPVQFADPQKLKECARYRGQQDAMIRCMDGR